MEKKREIAYGLAMKAWLLIFLFVVNGLVGAQNPLYESIKTKKAVILKHGAHDTSDMDVQLRDAIRRSSSFEIDGNVVDINGVSYFVNAHCLNCYAQGLGTFPNKEHPEKLHPALVIPVIRKTGLFLKCDFKCPRAIEPFAFLAQMIPPEQKVGHAFVSDLVVLNVNLSDCCLNELLTFDQVKQAREILGKETPFIVSCYGLNYQNISEELVDSLAEKAVGKAEFFNLNMPHLENPPTRFAEQLWVKHGLVPEIRIHTKADKEYWDAQEFPYIGLTDDPDLATSFIK